MKTIKAVGIAIVVSIFGITLASFLKGTALPDKNYKFPFKHAGLDERGAAAHLLNRFTYGATPAK
jgi:hypothetical protein